MSTRFTSGQVASLKAAILAETNTTFVEYRNQGQTGLMAEWLSQPHPSVRVWNPRAPVNDLLDTIDFAQFTLNALPDAAGAALFTARSMAVQTKQMNLQNMTLGKDVINCAKNRVRSGLLDAVIDLPTGTNGAQRSAAGSAGIRITDAMTRPASRVEAVFAVNPATTGSTTANNLVVEGGVTDADIVFIINS